MTRRDLFTRLLSALAAVPLVGKLAEKPAAKPFRPRSIVLKRMVAEIGNVPGEMAKPRTLLGMEYERFHSLIPPQTYSYKVHCVLESGQGVPAPSTSRVALNREMYPAEYLEWYDHYWAYADAHPKRVAAHQAELRRLFPILYADD